MIFAYIYTIVIHVKFLAVAFWSYLMSKLLEVTSLKNRSRSLENQLSSCSSYNEFKRIAYLIDEETGMNEWKKNPQSNLYDYVGIRKRLISLSALMISPDDVYELKRQLRACLVRNISGIGDPRLHTACRIGTKLLIENYVDFVNRALRYICDGNFGLPLREQFEYFYETKRAYGRSALCLSGGATLGMYHLGVLKVLYVNKLLPKVISGSSVGAIIASFFATKRDDELEDVFNRGISLRAFDTKGSARRKLYRLLTEGALMDIRKLEKMIRDNVRDLTFKEAYEKTKRILNITVASATPYETSRLLNYLTAPNILIWSAAAASCALTFLYKPVELMAKDREGNIVSFTSSDLLWADGSMTTDLPMVRLSELFNVNNFIVSQVNPHVVPFIWTSNLGLLGNLIRDEIQLRLKQVVSCLLASVLNQKYTGNVTIVPDLSWRDFARLLKNPESAWMMQCCRKSERKTWEQLSYIKHLCSIELTLDYCTRKLARRLRNTGSSS
ncbi:uncharacterized protein LOC126332792 isoform X2 [Schistocerca gregaria]|uniref:uncharacterized protein LOC126332792 isoform X2 n=1 Tax=Schistocerca gregaria TaxID=7010 RepID=UPI00211DF8C7|nr:uncharacterized protein LOC126332792 isoform X2 [Schistocerca gregaria]